MRCFTLLFTCLSVMSVASRHRDPFTSIHCLYGPCCVAVSHGSGRPNSLRLLIRHPIVYVLLIRDVAGNGSHSAAACWCLGIVHYHMLCQCVYVALALPRRWLSGCVCVCCRGVGWCCWLDALLSLAIKLCVYCSGVGLMLAWNRGFSYHRLCCVDDAGLILA